MASENNIKRQPHNRAGYQLSNQKYLYHFIVLAFSFLLYANTIFNDYNLDDGLVTRNHKLTSLGAAAIPQIFSSPYYSDDMGYSYGYRPITLTTFALEHQFFGESALVSHLINVLLYAFLCLVVFVVIKQLLPSAALLSLFITLLFTSHPIHTEVVCSIKNREEILALLFSFLAFWVVLAGYRSKFWLANFAAALFFTLALLSKITVLPMAVAIPLALIVLNKAGLKQALVSWAVLMAPALLIADINLLFYKVLLLAGSGFSLGLVFFIKNQGYKLLKSKILELTTKEKASPLKVKVKQPALTKVTTIEKETATHPLIDTNKWHLRLQKFKPAALLFISISALLASVYGLFLNDFIWTGVGSLIIIGGLYLYKKTAWYINAVGAFLLTILIIEKYDLPLEIINGVVNVLLLTLLIFARSRKVVFFTILYSLFAVHSYFKNGHGILEIVFIGGFLLLIKAYAPWLRKHLYWLLAIAVMVIFAAWLSGKSDPVPKPLEDIQLAPFFLVLVVLSQIKGKGQNVVIALMIFFVPVAFMAEAKLSYFDVYKTYEYRERMPAQHRPAYSIFDKFPDYKIKSAFDPVRIAANEVIQDFKKDLETSKHNASGNLIRLRYELSESFKKLNQQVVSGKNKLETTQNKVVNKITTYEVKNIVPIQQNRPLAYIETPVQQKDPAAVKAAAAMDVLLRYFELTLWPHPLSFYYGYKELVPLPLSDWKVVLSAIVHVLLLLLAMLFLCTRQYLLFYGIAYYLVMVIPFTNVWSVAGMLGERYLFGASLGFCIFLGWGFFRVFKIEYQSPLTHLKPIMVVTGMALLLVYSFSSFVRSTKWKDDLTLMRHDIKNVDQSAQAHNLLAMHLMEHSDLVTQPTEKAKLINEALIHFNRATEIYPFFFNAVYYTGRVYEQIGMTDSAIATYKRALIIDSTFVDLHLTLGDLLQNNGRYEEALYYYNLVLQDRPLEYTGYDKLSYTYYLLHQYTTSIKVNQQAIVNLPGVVDPYVNIGRTYIALHETDSARIYFQRALAIDSNNAIAKTLLVQVDTQR